MKLGRGKKGKVDVLISSLDDVKSVDDAKAIIDRVKPNYVVWAAGMFIYDCQPFLYPDSLDILQINTHLPRYIYIYIHTTNTTPLI